jgi:hypothetical protein
MIIGGHAIIVAILICVGLRWMIEVVFNVVS